jgi:hypothetical protein
VEHRHHCLYCPARWFCSDDSCVVGPAVCDECRQALRSAPDTPLRVIPLGQGDRVLDRLTQQEAERWRERFRRGRRG